MARQPRSRDWQERAFEESELARRGQLGGESPGTPDDLRTSTDRRRRSSWGATGIAVLIVVVAVIVRVHLNNRAPSLTTSCTTPAFALSSTSPHQGSTERWSATGPAGTHFVITMGIDRLVPEKLSNQLHAVPEAGHTAAMTQQAVHTTALSSACKASGAFLVGVPAGTYTVRMFRIEGTGTNVSGTAVASKTVTVSS
jgi:hypothetical protein